MGENQGATADPGAGEGPPVHEEGASGAAAPAGGEGAVGGRRLSAPTTEYSQRPATPPLDNAPAGAAVPAVHAAPGPGPDFVQGKQAPSKGAAAAPADWSPARRGTSEHSKVIVEVATSQHLGTLQPPPHAGEQGPEPRVLPDFGALSPLQKVAAWWGCMSWATRAIAFIYMINVFITFSSQLGWYGPSNTDLSRKYQTFVTPAGGAFSIWGLIFIAEGVFTIYILFPSQSGGNRLVDRLAPPWALAQLFQIVWTLVFAAEALWVSLVCMVGIWVSLVALVMRLDVGRGTANAAQGIDVGARVHVSYAHWWAYYFGFHVHLGWITAATLVNANVVLRSYNPELTLQIAVAIVSLAAAILSACFWVYTRRDAVHSFVIAWALFFLGNNLNDPLNPLPYAANGTDVVVSLALATYILSALATYVLSVIALIVAVLSLAMHLFLFVVTCTQAEQKVEEITGWHISDHSKDWTIHNRYDYDPSVSGPPEEGKEHAHNGQHNGPYAV